MKIDDSALSAFLDAELPAAQMESVRTALAHNESLANRLAELAMVDELVKNTYTPIEQLPLPDSVSRLLAAPSDADTIQTAKVIAFPVWKRVSQHLQRHAAVAASVALVIGLGIGGITSKNFSPTGPNQWQQIANVLEIEPSGITRQLADGSRVIPQLSFISRSGEFCRQYYFNASVATNNNFAEPASRNAEQGIACREKKGWHSVAKVPVQQQVDPNVYQTAAGGGELEDVLDRLMLEDALDADAEQQAIDNQWQRTP